MKLVPLFGTQMKQKLNCINDKTIANGQIIATLCNTLLGPEYELKSRDI